MLPSKRRIAAENTDRAKGAKSSKSLELACFLVFGVTGFGIISISLVIREEIPKES
jgi:nitrate reductase NapE component